MKVFFAAVLYLLSLSTASGLKLDEVDDDNEVCKFIEQRQCVNEDLKFLCPHKCSSVTTRTIILGCNPACRKHYAPICGTNGKTYANECTFNYAQCIDPDANIEINHIGKCGRNPVPRIIGGFNYEESIPWIVMLYINDRTELCTGSLINSQYILTAAHCLLNNSNNCSGPLQKRPISIEAAIGENDFKNARQFHQVNDYWVHPQFNGYCNNLAMDYAVLKLVRPVSNNPVCLGSYRDGGQLFAMGYGWTKQNTSSVSSQLKAAEVQNIPMSLCRDRWGERISKNNLCTLGKKDYVYGPCSGDSGGPLTFFSKSGGHIQIGVMSYIGANNEKRCLVYYPDVYGRVSAALPFIRSIAGSVKTC